MKFESMMENLRNSIAIGSMLEVNKTLVGLANFLGIPMEHTPEEYKYKPQKLCF